MKSQIRNGVTAAFEEKRNGDFVIHIKLDTNLFGRALRALTDQEWDQVVASTVHGMHSAFRAIHEARFPPSDPREMLFGRRNFR